MRKSNIELLRIILIFLLIAWHYSVHTYGPSITFLIIAFPSASVVPIFAIITGYFLSKSQSYSFPLKFLLTFVYVYLINAVVASIVYGTNHELNHGTIVWLFNFGGRDWWYLWALLIIYLLAPIINRGLKLINKNYFFAMMAIFTILFFVLSRWIKFEYVSAGGSTSSGIILLLYYYFIGAGFRLYLAGGGSILSRYRKFIYIFAPLILICLTIGVVISYTKNENFWSLINPSGVLVLISSITIFTLFHEIRIKDSKIINYFASLGLIVYLFHYLFQYLMVKYKPYWSNVVDVNYIINTLLTYAMTMVFAIPITFILKVSVNSSLKGLNFLNEKLIQKREKTKKQIE